MLGVEAVSIRSNRQFPRHAHDDYGLGVLDSGAHTTWSGVGQVEAVVNDVIAVNPGEMHDGAPIGGGMRAWRMVYLDPALVDTELSDETNRPLEIVRPVVKDEVLRAVLNRFFKVISSDTRSPLLVEEALLAVLIWAFRHHSARSSRELTTPPTIARARQWLDDAPASSISLADLADAAGISRFQLLRGFSSELGVTPHAYLIQRRVRLARQLIGYGRSLSEAAAESGFADQSHMTRAFVRQLGVTPACYRAAICLA